VVIWPVACSHLKQIAKDRLGTGRLLRAGFFVLKARTMSKANNPLLDPKKRAAATQLVHGGGRRTEFHETSEALFLNSGYSYPSSEHAERLFLNQIPGGHNYSRFANPGFDMLQERMALVEGAEAARVFATGMAAVTNAIMSQVRAGDHIVAAQALFGGCRYVVEDYAPRFGVESSLVDGRDPENFARAMRPNTRVVFLETPTNPTLELVDIRAVAEIAHAHGAKLIVDNVFATALYQKPLELGADIVVYSATKHIDGQGRVLGGIVLGSREIIEGDALQRLGAAQGAGNLRPAGDADDRQRRKNRRCAGRPPQDRSGDLSASPQPSAI
jgi:O-succinylhomoserine sulfhydrylase